MLEAPLMAAIDDLPPEFKMTVQLADIEEMSYREIAESMDCPIGTVMSRLHRGRRWLRARLFSEAEALGLIEEEDETPAHDGASPAPVELSRYRQKKGVG
jgi:RNA polymerase sigma-70 factor (ECF subfamily)